MNDETLIEKWDNVYNTRPVKFQQLMKRYVKYKSNTIKIIMLQEVVKYRGIEKHSAKAIVRILPQFHRTRTPGTSEFRPTQEIGRSTTMKISHSAIAAYTDFKHLQKDFIK